MTDRLYYTDAYLREFEAAVVDHAEGARRIYLDRTAFYPTSGGQPFDLGTLGGIRVVDVVDEEDRIAHLLAHPLEAAGPVRGSVDWGRRFDHMQQHTGQHLLSAVLHELFGQATISVHFGRDASTLDLDSGALEHDGLLQAERRANEVVTENRPVEVAFEESGSAEGLRKASARSGTLRIVSIRDLDRSACGGTHVRATGEIGPILITRSERVKKNLRLEFLCGMRAVRRARADLDLLARLAGRYSAAAEELPALLDAQRDEIKAAAGARRDLEEQLAARIARDLYAAATPAESGVRTIVSREEAGPVERLRPLAQAVSAMSRALFVGWTANPPALRGRNVGRFGSSMQESCSRRRWMRWADEGVGIRGWLRERRRRGTRCKGGCRHPSVPLIAKRSG